MTYYYVNTWKLNIGSLILIISADVCVFVCAYNVQNYKSLQIIASCFLTHTYNIRTSVCALAIGCTRAQMYLPDDYKSTPLGYYCIYTQLLFSSGLWVIEVYIFIILCASATHSGLSKSTICRNLLIFWHQLIVIKQHLVN